MAHPDKIQNLVDYFSQLRKRPGMYLGTNTISKLYDHLQGYQMAYWFNDIDNPADKNFFDNFNQFIYSYYSVTTSDNWKGVILEQCCGNEENALTTFFELFDLFVGNIKTPHTKLIVIEVFDKLVYDQNEMKEKLGHNFPLILNECIELIKDNAISNLKYDFDFILERLNERAKEIPELKSLLTELQTRHSS